METKELSTEVKSYSLDLTTDSALKTLTQTVAKGATPPELALFVEMCRSTGLNPFKREIWFIKTAQGVQMMTGINGFYQIANKHPMYDGTETEIVEEGGRIIKAVARVHRKDRKIPSIAEAYMEEYAKPYGNWKTMPRVMISKCAESMALRKAFPQELNGLYSTEEMPREFDAPKPGQQAKVTIDNDELPESWNQPPVDLTGSDSLDAPTEELAESQPEPQRGDYWYSIGYKATDIRDAFKRAVKELGGRYEWNSEKKLWFSDVFIEGFEDYQVEH